MISEKEYEKPHTRRETLGLRISFAVYIYLAN
jgi:hypothetical protein